jgi:hypothetical protein
MEARHNGNFCNSVFAGALVEGRILIFLLVIAGAVGMASLSQSDK